MVFLALDSVTNDYNLYVPHDPYSPSELSAMAYHGVLRPQFGPYYIDVTTPETAAQRAKGVRMAGEQLISGDWTATLLTAAWIHLGGQAPEMFEAGTATYQRARFSSRIIPTAFRHMDYMQQADLPDEDLLVIGGIVVTSIELTIEDLLRTGRTPRHHDRARDLADMANLGDLQQRFHRNRHLKGMYQARQHLEQFARQVRGLADAHTN